jgi:hypothetical protein
MMETFWFEILHLKIQYLTMKDTPPTITNESKYEILAIHHKFCYLAIKDGKGAAFPWKC